MSEGDTTDGGPGRLIELLVADDAAGWVAAGFTVDDDQVRLGDVTIRLIGRSDANRGICGWTLAGVAMPSGSLDGLPTAVLEMADLPQPQPAATHPNGVTTIDHVVVLTPDLDRTIEALAAIGVDLRRIRDTESYGAPMRQAFFKLGPIVLEVVSGDTGSGAPAADAPAAWFGLAVNATDLDALADQLGDRLGTIKGAVQSGRRIATLRHRDLGMSLAVAVMDDHAGR